MPDLIRRGRRFAARAAARLARDLAGPPARRPAEPRAEAPLPTPATAEDEPASTDTAPSVEREVETTPEAQAEVAPADPRRRPMPELPDAPLPDGPVNRPDLKVAVILDAMSTLGFRYEWDQIDLQAATWREQVEGVRPDLLFVESAWHGEWSMPRASSKPPRDVVAECVGWFREQGIPTVFWNKEDPPNYDLFISTARLFDHVFTIDSDLFEQYRTDLGHDRIDVLPFAAQPRLHNPAHRGRGRKGSTAFAGTYHAGKYPERRAQMEAVLGAAVEHDLDIYSRFDDDERYAYPEPFTGHVVGSLPYERLTQAYTAYKVFLNVNSTVDSTSACARRLFELSAAATPVVSGRAAAIAPFFGEDIAVAHSRVEAERELGMLLRQGELRDRRGWRAHRRVYSEHLYTHRVDRILQAAGVASAPVDRSVSAVVPTMRPGRVGDVLTFLGAQEHLRAGVELVLLTHGFEVDEAELRARATDLGLSGVVVRHVPSEVTLGTMMNLGVEAASGRYVAKMDDDNHYGPHYLSDLVDAFSWTDAQVVGKWAHYVHLAASDTVLLRFAGAEHKASDLVQGGTIISPRDVAAQVRFEDLPRRVDTTYLEKIRAEGGLVYSSDRFSFLSRRGADAQGHTWPISDADLLSKKFSRVVTFGDGIAHVEV